MSTARPGFWPLGPFRDLRIFLINSFRLYFARFGRHVTLAVLPLAVALALSAWSEWVYFGHYTVGPLAHLAASLEVTVSTALWVAGIGVACAFIHEADEGWPQGEARGAGRVLPKPGAILGRVLPVTLLVGLAGGVGLALFWPAGLLTLYAFGLAPLAALEERGRLVPSLRLSVAKTLRALLEVGFVQSGALCFTVFISLFRLGFGITSALFGDVLLFSAPQAMAFPVLVLFYAWVGVALSLAYRKGIFWTLYRPEPKERGEMAGGRA